MRRVVALFLILFCFVGISLAYFYWPKIEHRYRKLTINRDQEVKDIARTKELLNISKPEEALEIIQQYSDDIDNRTDIGREWLDLLIRASEATLNTNQLVLLHEYYPKSFDSHEKAALMVANYYLGSGRSKDYQSVRDSWKGRETIPETWFVLDGDKFLVEGRRKEGIQFLKSHAFPGKADTARLVRLALLYIFEDPKTAWEFLTQAYTKDPENPEIRSYRAKLLETVGKKNLALSEYISAVQTDPKNLYLRDQLAEFYLRDNKIPLALQVWMENLKSPTLDFIWLKTLFWNRVVTPISFDWSEKSPPAGKLEPLVAYLLELKPGVFWNSTLFSKVSNGQNYLKTQQPTFWLRLLQLLKDGKEKEAYELLQFNPFQTISANAQLEHALKQTLLYRSKGVLRPDTEISALETPREVERTANTSQSKPYFFAQLDALEQEEKDQKGQHFVSEDMNNLLTGPDAFAAAFLATGWYEAALNLQTLNVVPSNYPEWYSYELTEALRQNRSTQAALQFATLQNPSPALSLLIGELLIASNNSEAALEHLLDLSKEENEIGKRAALLISLINIDRGQYTDAKIAIASQPSLSKDILGQETLARIALLEGDTEQADKLYASLEDKSAEAKSYLARKAFAEKDWKRAKDLTEQLLRIYPTNQLLQDNLKKIMGEQNKTK